jgi:hypothetical protein
MDAVSGPRDFWLSCGHHLLDRGAEGRLVVTEEFLKAYLARPELMPPAQACAAEREIHASLLRDPCLPVALSQITSIADPDAQENWQCAIAWRDHLLSEPSLEAAYLSIARNRLAFPPLFLDHLVQLILRNALDDCADAFVLRAAESFFRAQRLRPHAGSLFAQDVESTKASPTLPSPLTTLLGLGDQDVIDVLTEDNASAYWERSDAFDLGLDLTAGRRGLAALGEVAACWIRHLLGVDVTITAVSELRDAKLTWYVGLDPEGTRIGDALWNEDQIDEPTRQRVVGLYQLRFVDEAAILEIARDTPTFLIAAASPDWVLRLKPQNLLTGLPLRTLPGAPN